MSDNDIADDKKKIRRKDNNVELASPRKNSPASRSTDSAPYSVFTQSQKRLITLLIGLGMLFSPMSANIYFPCIPALQESYHTSRQLVNLTITSYVIVQGIAPAFFGDLADMIGRRPVYLVTFTIYVAASLGLALQRIYAALLVLRMLQSFGCSATVAIGYGVIADVVPSSQRGSMLGPAMVATNLGPSLGPLLGGVLADRAGWRWVFWLLCIMGVTFLASIVLYFPETTRSIVGNGGIAPKGWHRTLASRLTQRDKDGTSSTQQDPLPSCRRQKSVIPNPFKSVELIFNKNTSLVLSLSAIYYTIYYCTQASLAGFLADIYGYNELQVGLCFLAIGFGVALGGYANGKLLDRCYRITAEREGIVIDRIAGDDMTQFPIERARTLAAYPMLGLSTLFVIGYGWVLQVNAHPSAPLIFQFCIGFITTCIVQTFNTLLVDMHSSNPSIAAASGNITRCALSAGGIAAMQPLLNRLSTGWYFTLLGGLSAVGGTFAVFAIKQCGAKWRNERTRKGDHS